MAATTRWTSRASVPRISEGCVTKFASHKALNLIAWGKLTFDERVVAHRVDPSTFGVEWLSHSKNMFLQTPRRLGAVFFSLLYYSQA